MIATDYPELFSNVQELNITPSHREENSVSDQQKYKFTLDGFVPFSYKGIGTSLAPTVIVSNTILQEWFGEPAGETAWT